MTEYTTADIDRMQEVFKSLRTEYTYPHPVEWNEKNRYLPRELTVKPGFINYDLFPFWKEVLYEMSPHTPTIEIGVMKGRQVAGTTMLIEADIAYRIANALGPMVYATSTTEMLEKNMEVKVEKAIDNCNLRHLIGFPQGKQGRNQADKKKEKIFTDGTFLHGVGLQSAAQVKSFTYRAGYVDECDEADMDVKGQGSAVDLVSRTVLDTYGENGGMILYISTPSEWWSSQIFKIYKQGDRRQFMVECLHCHEPIDLVRHIKKEDSKTGDPSGLMFRTTESNALDTSAGVYYKCQLCGGLMTNDDKQKMFIPGFWQPTATSMRQRLKTYSINKLYAPATIYSWESCINELLQCYNYNQNKVTDIAKFKLVVNNVDGLPFKKQVGGIKKKNVQSHQRTGFLKNTIPNRLAIAETGSDILLVLCTVDAHKHNLRVDLKGYTVGGQSWTIDWRTITPDDDDKYDCEDIRCSAWTKLKQIILSEEWVSDNNKKYYPRWTAIDSGWKAHVVYEFCKQFQGDVIPVKGDILKSGINFQEMGQSVLDELGTNDSGDQRMGYIVNVNNYKSKIQALYNKPRSMVGGRQAEWTMNFNEDLNELYFKMFTAEHEEIIKDKLTNKEKGTKWVQDSDNHSFDTAVYNIALLEIVATLVCEEEGIEQLSWPYFWAYCLTGAFYEVI